MKLKSLLKLLSVLLAAKAIFGVLYIVLGWQISLAGMVMPTWLIIVAIIVDGYLAYLTCKFSKGKK